MRIAILCSDHGFGHVTRQTVIAKHLQARGHEVVFFAGTSRELVADSVPGTPCVTWCIDAGIVQIDSVTEDLGATLELLDERCNDDAVTQLSRALRGFRLAIVDTAPAALEACRRANLPAVAVGNFDWAWVYSHYPALEEWAERFRAWQAPHPAISLWPGPPMGSFARVTKCGLVGRRAPPKRIAASREKGVVVSFGGAGLSDLDAFLPRIRGIRWLLAPPMPPLRRPDCSHVSSVPYPALIAGADAILTKPGYGVFAEASLSGTPIVWIDRGDFPEAAWLEAAMRTRGDLKIRQTTPAALEEAISARLASPRPIRAVEGTSDVVDAILAAHSHTGPT